MKCIKCSGLMIQQASSENFFVYEGWRCLNCGKVILKKEEDLDHQLIEQFDRFLKREDF